jgi:hypothetical protein
MFLLLSQFESSSDEGRRSEAAAAAAGWPSGRLLGLSAVEPFRSTVAQLHAFMEPRRAIDLVQGGGAHPGIRRPGILAQRRHVPRGHHHGVGGRHYRTSPHWGKCQQDSYFFGHFIVVALSIGIYVWFQHKLLE